MVTLTFYGGIKEIGGNKILLEDGERRLFLDFGFPYKRYKRFYEEYLKPRSGAGLLDPLVMGLLPPLEGLYREDLAPPELWYRFREDPLYRQLEPVEGVLLTHAHLDHSGHISFLKQDIPVYATAETAFITKAIQDSGKADFDQQVCYFTPAEYQTPNGWQQPACLTGGEKLQRQFCLADLDPETLSPEAREFWAWGFWEKTARQKELVSCPLETHHRSRFNLRCFPVDHSIPGACAWGVETSSGWVVYSGDLRLHGKRSELTEAFLHEASLLRPRALVLEGTNVRREKNTSEGEVYQKALQAIAGAPSLVIADFSPRDVDRLLTFHRIARETRRKLAMLAKDAYLLKTLHLLDSAVPDPVRDSNMVLYQETSKSPAIWQRYLFQEFGHQTVLAKDVRDNPGDFILCFSFFDLNELPSIQPPPGTLYLFSSSEPHDEEQEIDFRRLHEWLRRFGIKGYGLPVEIKKDCESVWEVPEGERGLHASGHASAPDLLRIAREIAPGLLLPVHCETPEFYQEHLKGSGIRVILPGEGEGVAI
ncbi:MAG: MBL fold metallo-hydrolase RNA specificity domain-containing protein [Chloroflexota bacterium]